MADGACSVELEEPRAWEEPAATWDVRSVPMFIRTSNILCSLIYKKAVDGSQVVTLIPLRFR